VLNSDIKFVNVQLGLLKDTRSIGTREGWQKCLEKHGVEIRDYSVFSVKDADT
jgi:hypothetical protein